MYHQPGEREAELIDGAFSAAPAWDQFWDQSEHDSDQLQRSETQ